MALPETVLPASLPPLLGSDHGIQEGAVFGNFQAQTTAMRKRRLRTQPHRTIDIAWDLEQWQMVVLHNWYENELRTGQRHFSIEVANQGPGLLWWEAEWEAPYQATPNQSLGWSVTGRLRLYGLGAADGPVDTGLHIEYQSALTGQAVGTLRQVFGVEFAWDLVENLQLRLAFEYTWPVAVQPPSSYLVDDPFEDTGARLLQESGGNLLLE